MNSHDAYDYAWHHAARVRETGLWKDAEPEDEYESEEVAA